MITSHARKPWEKNDLSFGSPALFLEFCPKRFIYYFSPCTTEGRIDFLFICTVTVDSLNTETDGDGSRRRSSPPEQDRLTSPSRVTITNTSTTPKSTHVYFLNYMPGDATKKGRVHQPNKLITNSKQFSEA